MKRCSEFINIGRSISCYFLLLTLLFSTSSIYAKEIISLGEYGSVRVTYSLVSKQLGSTKAIDLDKIGSKVDLNVYPDANLRIIIEPVELKSRHKVYLCPTCYPTKIPGFSRRNTPKPFFGRGSSIKINYVLDESLFSLERPSALALTLYVAKDGDVIGRSDGYRSVGQAYQLILAGEPNSGVEDIIEPTFDLEDIISKLQDGVSFGDPAMQVLCKNKERLRDRVSDDIWDKILEKCKEGEKIVKATPKPRTNRPRTQTEVRREPRFNVDEFTIREIRRDESNGDVKITLEFSTKPDELYAPSLDLHQQWSQNRVVLTVPRGIRERIRAIFNDFDQPFPIANGKGRDEYVIDTEAPPLKVDFENRVDEKGQLAMNIEGGHPPYDLRLLDGSQVIAIVPIGDRQRFTLKKEAINAPSGSYDVQVFDRDGNDLPAAKWGKEYEVGGGMGSLLRTLIIPLVLLLIGAGVYFIYLRGRQGSKLTEDEIAEIERLKKGLGPTPGLVTPPGGTAEKVMATATSAKSEAIRKNITILQKNASSERAPSIGTLAYPKIKTLSEELIPVEFLLGQADEYRLINMHDLWEDSFVSEIYMREVFAYRIHKFVFEDNKELLEERGEKIPEIGGWILGRKLYDKLRAKYILSFERFIQMHRPADNSTTQLTFGADAWHALDKAKDIYKEEELELVGWFHTHPGWGVFLSGEDINTHETFFAEPFHIAMELESVQKPHDVGFFSRRKDRGKLVLNNRAKAYYRWSDFRQWLGKHKPA